MIKLFGREKWLVLLCSSLRNIQKDNCRIHKNNEVQSTTYLLPISYCWKKKSLWNIIVNKIVIQLLVWRLVAFLHKQQTLLSSLKFSATIKQFSSSHRKWIFLRFVNNWITLLFRIILQSEFFFQQYDMGRR